jgi:serine/threonine protein kinase
MVQLLEAIRFLHSNYVLHRDLKLSNLLYNHRGELKVADFGLARRVGAEYIARGGGGRIRDGTRNCTHVSFAEQPNSPPCCLTPKVVSLWYRPPELLLGAQYYDSGVDLWGCGCIMGELLRGKPIMDGKNELDQLQKMVRRLIVCAYPCQDEPFD